MALSPTSSRGSGGSSPTTHAQYSGNPVTVADGDTQSMTWNTKEIGDDLLDLTVPALPTVISAGVYAFTLGIYLTAALTAGGRYEIYFGVDSLSDGAASILPPSSPAVVPNLRPRLYCGITYYVSAGGTLDLQVSNEDGAAARTFYLASAVVQRLA